MPSEFAPPGGRPKVTKKQVQEMQENYQKAQALAEDTSEEEAKEKALVDELFEGELENAFMEDKKIGIYVGRFQPFHK
jgi:nicotinamide mononucleotide adenylyltransferase